MPPEQLVHLVKLIETSEAEQANDVPVDERTPCTQHFTREGDVWMLGLMLAQVAGFKLPSWGLGWCMNVASEVMGKELSVSDVERWGWNSIYTQYARESN